MNKDKREWEELFPEEQHYYIRSLIEAARKEERERIIDIIRKERDSKRLRGCGASTRISLSYIIDQINSEDYGQ